MASWFADILPFTFASPLFLLGAGAAVLFFVLFSLKKKPLKKYSDFRMFGGPLLGEKILRGAIWILALAVIFSLFGALARPEVVKTEAKTVYSRDFCAVMDFSISMDAKFKEDGGREGKPAQSKFDAGRDALFEFIQGRTSEDRFCLVLFADEAFSLPLLEGTEHILENYALRRGLPISEAETVPLRDKFGYRGTKIGKGVLAASSVFERMNGAETRVIILMTDLGDDPSLIVKSFNEARESGVSRIYILATDAQESEIKYIANSDLPKGLVEIFDIRNISGLEDAYEAIEGLEISKTGESVSESKKSVGKYFFYAGLALFAALAMLSFTIWRKSL